LNAGASSPPLACFYSATLAWNLSAVDTARAAFVKPMFLIMIMTRFHALIEHQPINAGWVAYLDQLSGKFRDLGQRAQSFAGTTAPRPAAPGPSPAV
jgi:hypothetical protein